MNYNEGMHMHSCVLDMDSSYSSTEVSSNAVTGDCEGSEEATCWDSEGEFSAL